VGHSCEKNKNSGDGIPCSRPGCYELFLAEHRSPLKKFCSCSCRRALRRVIEREQRWRRRQERLRE
jgi:hypothetical protein